MEGPVRGEGHDAATERFGTRDARLQLVADTRRGHVNGGAGTRKHSKALMIESYSLSHKGAEW